MANNSGASSWFTPALVLQLLVVLLTAVSSGIMTAVAMRDQAKVEIMEAVRREQANYLTQVEFQRWLVTNERQYQQILRNLQRIEDRLK